MVLATSAKPDEVEHYLDLLDARGLADAWTSAGDVEQTKPAPDLVEAALESVGGGPAVMIGDSTWDCRAAANAGVETIAVLTGGFSDRSCARPARSPSSSRSTSCASGLARPRWGRPRRMSILDKITGRFKKAAGDLADDASLRREGAREERKGEAKEELADAHERADAKAEEVANLERKTS